MISKIVMFISIGQIPPATEGCGVAVKRCREIRILEETETCAEKFPLKLASCFGDQVSTTTPDRLVLWHGLGKICLLRRPDRGVSTIRSGHGPE